MKIEQLTYILIAGTSVAAGLLAVFRSSLQFDSVFGYGVVLALGALAAIDYGISWKWFGGR
jgi:hypothetical protein